jgi:hypothetical protein
VTIGFIVQGTNDLAFLDGLRVRYCPNAIIAQPHFRGSSRESLRREIRKALGELRYRDCCDYFVILTDADVNPWREVHRNEWAKIPAIYQHVTIFGVAERNIECWLAASPSFLASELDCEPNEIPIEDPSDFVKARLRALCGPEGQDAWRQRVVAIVCHAPLGQWLRASRSFEHFWDQIVRMSKQQKGCQIPNERNSS